MKSISAAECAVVSHTTPAAGGSKQTRTPDERTRADATPCELMACTTVQYCWEFSSLQWSAVGMSKQSLGSGVGRW